MSNFRLGDSVCLFDFFADHSHLSNMELDKLVELFQTNKHEEAKIGDGGTVNHSVRQSNLLWFDDEFMSRNNCYDIHKKITNRVDELNHLVFKLDLLYIEPFQLTEYTSNQKGFYNYHIDANPVTQNLTRKLSFVIQLSDASEFQGGDFCTINAEGKEFNVSQERPDLMKKGSIIVFPSFIPHKVTPVTSGTRYSLVGWCNGPRFR